MKYGDTLQQRSIPLWETYNIDYNDIKRLIKVRTTQGQGQAKAIPGSNNAAKQLQAFEDELYRELRDQHQRIDLFVRSKAGEIGRRLAHLDKQIAQLEIRTFAAGQARISIKRLEKFSKAEAATLKAGEEIQSLSQFIGAQRLAFQKLLKKYRKWTGSPDLGNRFREEILDRPSSFSKRDFQPLLAQWTEVLACVRAPFDRDTSWYLGPSNANGKKMHADVLNSKRLAAVKTKQKASDSLPKTCSNAAELHSTWISGSNTDRDIALAVVPLGSEAAKAVYWIHLDNIVQIHVLLLQYTRLQKSSSSDASLDTPPSSQSSRRGSLNANNSKSFRRTDEEVGLIVCDDLQRFAKRRNSETISDSEDGPGTVAEKAAASIRYCRDTDAVVLISTVSECTPKSTRPCKNQLPSKATIEQEAIGRLFHTSQEVNGANGEAPKDSETVCAWLHEHQEVQPLVHLQSRRTRFVGLRNSQTSGIWATLDKDILMRPTSRETLARGKALVTFKESGSNVPTPFPHAVLEVRIEGNLGSDLINELDGSYLTERIRGFSLETHAVATTCKPPGMPRPFWLPALGQDIRKIPVTTTPIKGRVSRGQLTPEESSTRATSVSASSTVNGPSGSGFSAIQGESSVTSAPDGVTFPSVGAPVKKRRQSNRKRILEKGLRKPPQIKQRRYWNEFDDGSEGSEDEAYTILIDPNASFNFPGVTTITNFLTSVGSTIIEAKRNATAWLRPSQQPTGPEREALLDGNRSPSVQDSDISDEECSPRYTKPAAQHHYSTFQTSAQSCAVRARETLLSRSCLASFVASFVLLLIATILKTTGRRKAETTVDAGVIIGVAASLVFAIIAVGSMVGRKDTVGWAHRSIVILVFICIVLGGGALLAALN